MGRRRATRTRLTVLALIIGVLALVFATAAPYAPSAPVVSSGTSSPG